MELQNGCMVASRICGKFELSHKFSCFLQESIPQLVTAWQEFQCLLEESGTFSEGQDALFAIWLVGLDSLDAKPPGAHII